jgi:phage head maturation protease
VIPGTGMASNANATVDLPRLSRQATIMPKTLNDEMRTVDVVWTTGAPVLRGYFSQYWEKLSLDPKSVRLKRLNNGAPLLNAHDGSDACCVIGTVEPGTAVLEGKRGIATVRFAKAEDSPIADQIYRLVKDGIVQNISVGYQIYEMTKVSEGGADKIPIFEATDWEPYELSPVPMGADDGAGFRAASTERHACVFITRKQQQERPTMADDTDPDTGGARGGEPRPRRPPPAPP